MAADPHFEAPDFEVVNEYKSISVESRYDSNNGGLSMQNTQQITKVLRPLKTGLLKISGLRLDAGGKVYASPDIQIQVVTPSAAIPSQGAGPNRRGKNSNLSNRNVAGASTLVRAEIDKNAAYKGEQVIVSYYLYHRVKIFNIQVEKFPVLNGFLREDLEMPVMGQRLDSEQVILNGIPYERSLLARYAAYPLEEGKLGIDSISLRFNYYAGSRSNTFDDEDPFFGFFQQMAPRVGSGQSERLEIDVIPLPLQGRTEKFTGGIGEFNVISAVDKYEVRANEAITLSVKVEGRGNIAAIQAPQAKWPTNIELYDTKGKSQGGRGGVGEKIFEFLLIPRTPGEVRLLPLEFEFFDPVKKQFYLKTTDSFHIKVLDPAPGTAIVPLKQGASPILERQQDQKNPQNDEVRYLKPPTSELQNQTGGVLLVRIFYLCVSLVLVVLGALLAFDLFKLGKKKWRDRKKSRERNGGRNWTNLEGTCSKYDHSTSWKDITHAYETLESILLEEIDKVFQIGSRSMSRDELKSALLDENGLDSAIWDRIKALFEFSDLIRFAGKEGGDAEGAARKDLNHWILEGRNIASAIDSAKKSK
jgi:hypothetical protein